MYQVTDIIKQLIPSDKISQQQWSKIVRNTAKNINQEVIKTFSDALLKAYDSEKGEVNFIRLNQLLAQQRLALSHFCKKQLLISIHQEIGNDQFVTIYNNFISKPSNQKFFEINQQSQQLCTIGKIIIYDASDLLISKRSCFQLSFFNQDQLITNSAAILQELHQFNRQQIKKGSFNLPTYPHVNQKNISYSKNKVNTEVILMSDIGSLLILIQNEKISPYLKSIVRSQYQELNHLYLSFLKSNQSNKNCYFFQSDEGKQAMALIKNFKVNYNYIYRFLSKSHHALTEISVTKLSQQIKTIAQQLINQNRKKDITEIIEDEKIDNPIKKDRLNFRFFRHDAIGSAEEYKPKLWTRRPVLK